MESTIMIRKSFTLAGFQFIFRLITFVINLALIRYLEKDILGLVNVRLILLYSTVIFITREPFRKVCLGKNINKKNSRKLINLMWLILPFALFISISLTFVWCEVLSFPIGYTEYKSVVMMYGLSAVIELMSEPLWLISQMNLMVEFRTIIEALALSSRIILSTILFFHWPSLRLYAFGIAQLFYSFAICLGYFIYFKIILNSNKKSSLISCDAITNYRDLFPDLFQFEIEKEQFQMIKGFVFNCLLKQLLTEGERYMMTISNWISLEMQGEFDVISNLGSLAPRLVFSSIEDSCHLAFSRLHQQGIRAKSQNQNNIRESYRIFTNSLKIAILLGLTIVVFAQAYSWPLLVLYAGIDKATNGVVLLRVFAFYVLVLSLNGVSECFYYSAISKKELDRHTYRMVGFSVVFVVCGSLFVYLYGTVGVILANCVNMMLRIFVSTRFIKQFYEESEYSLTSLFKKSVPHRVVLCAYMLSLFVILISMNYFQQTFIGQLLHISIGVLSMIFNLVVLFSMEPDFLIFLTTKLKWLTTRKAKTI